MHAAQLQSPVARSRWLWATTWALTAILPLLCLWDYAFGPLPMAFERQMLTMWLVTAIAFAAFWLGVGGLFYPSRISDGICTSLAFSECLFLYLVKYHAWVDRWLSA